MTFDDKKEGIVVASTAGLSPDKSTAQLYVFDDDDDDDIDPPIIPMIPPPPRASPRVDSMSSRIADMPFRQAADDMQENLRASISQILPRKTMTMEHMSPASSETQGMATKPRSDSVSSAHSQTQKVEASPVPIQTISASSSKDDSIATLKINSDDDEEIRIAKQMALAMQQHPNMSPDQLRNLIGGKKMPSTSSSSGFRSSLFKKSSIMSKFESMKQAAVSLSGKEEHKTSDRSTASTIGTTASGNSSGRRSPNPAASFAKSVMSATKSVKSVTKSVINQGSHLKTTLTSTQSGGYPSAAPASVALPKFSGNKITAPSPAASSVSSGHTMVDQIVIPKPRVANATTPDDDLLIPSNNSLTPSTNGEAVKISGIAWKRRSGFGKFSTSGAWERRRFALIGGVLNYYRSRDNAIEKDDSNRSMDGSDHGEPRGYLDIVKEGASVAASQGHSGAPTPFALSIKILGQTKWKLCFDTHMELMSWLAALTDVIVRGSVDSYNTELVQSMSPSLSGEQMGNMQEPPSIDGDDHTGGHRLWTTGVYSVRNVKKQQEAETESVDIDIEPDEEDYDPVSETKDDAKDTTTAPPLSTESQPTTTNAASSIALPNTTNAPPIIAAEPNTGTSAINNAQANDAALPNSAALPNINDTAVSSNTTASLPEVTEQTAPKKEVVESPVTRAEKKAIRTVAPAPIHKTLQPIISVPSEPFYGFPEELLTMMIGALNLALFMARSSFTSIEFFWALVTAMNMICVGALTKVTPTKPISTDVSERQVSVTNSPQEIQIEILAPSVYIQPEETISKINEDVPASSMITTAPTRKAPKASFKPVAGTSAMQIQNTTDKPIRNGHTFAGWRAPDPEMIMVRSHGYGKTKRKVPSPGELYHCIHSDIFESKRRCPDMASRVVLPKVKFADDDPDRPKTWNAPDMFVVSVSLPTDPPKLTGSSSDGGGYVVTLYFAMRQDTRDILRRITADGYNPACDDTSSSVSEGGSEDGGADIQKSKVNAVRLFDEWCRRAPTDDSFMSRFKVVPNAQNLAEIGLPSWISSYNGKPFLIKRPGKTSFLYSHPEKSCMEFDISLHPFPYLAKKGICFMKDRFFKKVLVTFAFVIEGRADDELPECIIGLMQLCYPNPIHAIQAVDFFAGESEKSFEPSPTLGKAVK